MILNFRQNVRLSLILLRLTGGLIIGFGLLAIAGWFLNITALESVVPSYVTMKFNTALCFIASGISFLLLVNYSTPLVKYLFRLFTISFGVFGLISLSQNVFHWSAGIDQLFATDYTSVKYGLPFPGRMSPSTALCFCLLSVSFFGIDSKSQSYKAVTQFLLHFVSLLSFVVIIGFMLKVPYTLKFYFISTMSINTGIAFFLLSIAASTINYTQGITSLFAGNETGNILARKLFPRMVLIVIILNYIRTECQRNDYISAEFGTVLSTVVFLLAGLYLIRNALTEINLIDLKRTEAENETQLLNKTLEDIIHQRTLALEESNDRFLKIFNANPVCIAMTNIATGKYADVNPALLDMLGYTRDEVIGSTAAQLGIISAQYRQRMVDILATHGSIKNEDILMKDKNNEDRYALLSAEMLETGQQKYMMSFVYDITSRKAMEDDLQESKKSLEVLTDKLTNQNKQLLSFAHIISHNLRSPVSNLNLLVHLYKDSANPEEKEDLWKNFETVIEHLNTSLNDLLETLRIQEDTGKEREELSFEKIFKPISEVLIGQIMESGTIISTDFSKAGHIVYPKIYLESIMLNLISNAIKYRSPNRKPQINIETDYIDGETILTVKDNGLGINLERHQKNLFGLRKTFHRHSEAKGLGLFITKTQIEAMGGEISAESAVDVGTTFKVIFNKKLR